MFLLLGIIVFFRLIHALDNTWQFENLYCSGNATAETEYIIESQSDFDNLVLCSTDYGQLLLGSLIIGPDFEGPLNMSTVNSINGSIEAHYRDYFTGLIAPNLAYVNQISLWSLPSFDNLQLDRLSHFDSIFFDSLPLLEIVAFNPSADSQGFGDITITSCGLSYLTGLDAVTVWTGNLDFENNPNLGLLDLNGVNYPEGTTYSIKVSNNNNSVLVDLLSLKYVSSLTLENVTNAEISQAQVIYQDLTIIDYNSEVLTLDHLSGIGRSLSITQSPGLQDINFPELADTNTISIQDNPLLGIDQASFPVLNNVFSTNINASLSGNILPKLTFAAELLIVTYNTNWSCHHMDHRVRENKIKYFYNKGHLTEYECSVRNAIGDDISSHWYPFKLSHGGKIAIIVVSCVVAVVLLFIWVEWAGRTRPRRHAAREAKRLATIGRPASPEGLPKYTETDGPPQYELSTVHTAGAESPREGDDLMSNDDVGVRVHNSVGDVDHPVLHT